MTPLRFELNPIARRWLRAPDRGREPSGADDPDWQAWLLRRMSRGQIADVGGIFVDRALLSARFACASDRCAPGPTRGARVVSCCADVAVPLSGPEERRLREAGPKLQRFLRGRTAAARRGGWSAGFATPEDHVLCRPSRRCVFSRIDGAGRIRCRLHAFARASALDRGALQPVSCRLFPLIAVELPRGRVALTLVARHTYRLVGAFPPERYPCLSDPSMPPLAASMAGDLDWLLGRGFARALRERAGAEPG